jgi:hypothetical protein
VGPVHAELGRRAVHPAIVSKLPGADGIGRSDARDIGPGIAHADRVFHDAEVLATSHVWPLPCRGNEQDPPVAGTGRGSTNIGSRQNLELTL